MYYFKPHEDGKVTELFQPNDPTKYTEDGFLTVEEMPEVPTAEKNEALTLMYKDGQLVWEKTPVK
jgi:hypothetical protein